MVLPGPGEGGIFAARRGTVKLDPARFVTGRRGKNGQRTVVSLDCRNQFSSLDIHLVPLRNWIFISKTGFSTCQFLHQI